MLDGGFFHSILCLAMLRCKVIVKKLAWFVFTGLSVALGQTNPLWVNYTNTQEITSITYGLENDLWIGVRGGVVHLDLTTGATKVYTRATGLAPGDIVTVATLKLSKSVWAGGTNIYGWGLSEFRGSSWGIHAGRFGKLLSSRNTSYGYGLTLSGELGTFSSLTSPAGFQILQPVIKPTSIALDSSGRLWYTKYPLELVMRDGGYSQVFEPTDTTWKDRLISDMSIDSQGRIWMIFSQPGGEMSGVCMFDGSAWLEWSSSNSPLPDNRINKILVDGDDIVWITLDAECPDETTILATYDGLGWTIFDASSGVLPLGTYIKAVGLDNSGAIYFGSSSGVLYAYKDEEWSSISIADAGGLPKSPVRTIAEDSSGALWFGSIFDGVVRFDGTSWSHFDLFDFWINDIEAANGSIWVVGSSYSEGGGCGPGGFFPGGARELRGDTWIVHDDSLPSREASCVEIGPSNDVWIGTKASGVAKYDGNTWTAYNTSNSGIASNGINKLRFDWSGNLWIAHSGQGISKFDGSTWTVYNTSNTPVPTGAFIDLFEESSGVMWFLTNSHLIRFDGAEWITLTPGVSPPATGSLRCFAMDAKGNIWIGTQGYGVIKKEGSYWVKYDSFRSGLIQDEVEGVLIDRKQNKWFGSSDYGGGVSVFNESGITSIEKLPKMAPAKFGLSQNFPNPFNPTTTIRYYLPFKSKVRLDIFDLLGRKVATITETQADLGFYETKWNANVPAGIYCYRLEAVAVDDPNKRFVDVKKMILVK